MKRPQFTLRNPDRAKINPGGFERDVEKLKKLIPGSVWAWLGNKRDTLTFQADGKVVAHWGGFVFHWTWKIMENGMVAMAAGDPSYNSVLTFDFSNRRLESIRAWPPGAIP